MHSFRIPEASTHSIQNLVHRGVSSIAKNIIFIQQIPPPQYSTAPTFNHGFSPERVFHMYSHLENSSKLEIPSSHHLFYIIMHHHTLLFKHQVPIIPFHICKQSFIIPLFKHLVTGKSGKSSHPPHPPHPPILPSSPSASVFGSGSSSTSSISTSPASPASATSSSTASASASRSGSPAWRRCASSSCRSMRRRSSCLGMQWMLCYMYVIMCVCNICIYIYIDK